MKFRKKPVEIEVEAEQFIDGNLDNCFYLMGCKCITDIILSSQIDSHGRLEFRIQTPKSFLCAQLGDWIIKGFNEEFCACKPDIFEATYEPITENVLAPNQYVKTD